MGLLDMWYVVRPFHSTSGMYAPTYRKRNTANYSYMTTNRKGSLISLIPGDTIISRTEATYPNLSSHLSSALAEPWREKALNMCPAGQRGN